MAFITIATGVVSAATGLYKAIDGGVKAKIAKREAEAAKAELDKQKNKFENLDTSNPYLNMENVMEDLTVNQQASEFQKQQQMQSQANIMTQMRGSAGGSGIAALAQTMANQASLDAQASSADIAKQEQLNQQARAAEASRIQGLEREGELISRQAQQGKIETLMGMSVQEMNAAREARAAAQQQMTEGIGDTLKGGMQVTGGLMSQGKMSGLQEKLGTWDAEAGPIDSVTGLPTGASKIDANVLSQLRGASGGLSEADLQKLIAALGK